jgi:ABC-2 type transport system permease protein
MRHVPTLALRELASYFLRPMAYFVLLGFQVIALLDYFQLIEVLSDPRMAFSFSGRLDPMTGYIASSWMFWVALLVAIPALTMRLIAEEKRSGTIEGLLTVPVTETEVVVGKWIAGVVMYLALLAPFAVYLPFLWKVGGYDLQAGPLMALAGGLSSMGAMFVAIGVFFSATTRNQVEAAVGTFVALLLLLLITVVSTLVEPSAGWSETIGFLSVYMQLNDFAAGRLDLRVVALHLSVAALLLFLAAKVLEARRGA